VVSFDISLRLLADFNHPLSYERPFKFLRHLVGPLGIDNIIAMSAINIHSAIIKLIQHGNRHKKETDMEKEMETDNIHEHGHGHGNGHGHGISELLLSMSYGAIVPIAPYGIPLKYHAAISNGAIYL
jgi:hypothetical protein